VFFATCCRCSTCCLCRSLETSCCSDALCQICQRHIQYFDRSFRLAVEHRLVHEYDGKPPAQPVMKPNALVTQSPRTSAASATSANNGVAMETKVLSKQSKPQSQQSAVEDARIKFEQVLQASRQAAAAGSVATSTSTDTCSDKQQLTTNATIVASHFPKPENGLTSSLPYNQLVFAIFIKCVISSSSMSCIGFCVLITMLFIVQHLPVLDTLFYWMFSTRDVTC